jgi:hypothetical protein
VKYNPTTLSFTHPTQNTDGSPFGEADYAGTEFAFREVGGTQWAPTIAVPVAFGDGTGTLELAQLSLPRNVELEMAGATVAKNGNKSEWSLPSNSFIFDARVPLAPSVAVL